MVKYKANPPNPINLMMSARSFGNYNLSAAISDIIDNSIDANANKIDITHTFIERSPRIMIKDNGLGMSEDELIEAMRPATKNPDDYRSPDELGRFGWGLKSASFSQCKILKVISKKQGKFSGAVWDLDNVAEWNMGILSNDEIKSLELDISGESGTCVIWENCDRLSEEKQLDDNTWATLIAGTKEDLALTYHKYLEGKTTSLKKIFISLNGAPIHPYDPYQTSNEATQPLTEEPIKIDNITVKAKAYILPHFSKLARPVQEKLGGKEGMLKNQGFYVYRNSRLIIKGTWFDIVKFGEFSQLVRISLDVPNTLDKFWKITIDKSQASLPLHIKNQLKPIIDKAKQQSSRAYKSKGGKIGSTKNITVWERFSRANEIKFTVNRKHPLIQKMINNDNGKYVNSVLAIIEQNIPIDSLKRDLENNEAQVVQTVSDLERFKEEFDAVFPDLFNEYGSPNLLREALKNKLEPYKSNWKIVDDLLRDKGL